MRTIHADWPSPSNIKAYTTLRSSWGEYGKDPKSAESTSALKALLSLPDDPIWLQQTHSTTIIQAKPENNQVIADGSYTHEAGRVCVVLTADCLPILLCNKQGTTVAAIHAGWRGLAGGIVENCLRTLQLAPEDVLIWLGPAIGPHHFEVGSDVFQAFTQTEPSLASAFTPQPNEKWLADLYAIARQKLNQHGIYHIYGGNYCTYRQNDLFYSYRRDHGKTGRMASVIWCTN